MATSKAVAKKTSADLAISQELMDEIVESGELGYSEKAEDSLIPILGILQDNSGEIKKKHDRYIEGCEPGDLIIRSLQKVFKADAQNEDEGVMFQPCGFEHMWVEWDGEPGDGVPVKQYPFSDMPADATEVADPQNPDKKIWMVDNGNRLVDTRYHFGHIIGVDGNVPAVIPMAGSNHTPSRQWTTLMKQFHIPGSNRKAPSFFHQYMIQTVFVSKGANSWYKYKITHRGQIGDEDLLRAGLLLTKSVAASEVSADVNAEAGEADQDDIPV